MEALMKKAVFIGIFLCLLIPFDSQAAVGPTIVAAAHYVKNNKAVVALGAMALAWGLSSYQLLTAKPNPQAHLTQVRIFHLFNKADAALAGGMAIIFASSAIALAYYRATRK
jgi:hypothetical protein